MSKPLFEQIGLEHREDLNVFFAALADAGDERYFHPHPLTEEAAERITTYTGADFYGIGIVNHAIVAYGMLRGWDEGFAVPNLGIALHPAARGTGLAEQMMVFLHTVARDRGASRVRLRVYPGNERAIALYRRLGYVFEGQSSGQLLATCILRGARSETPSVKSS
jgi:[ribosomal protein S18]-alanine N-acetyltransferase